MQSCEDRFYAAQALELTDPAYGAVHHLSVPCYLLQHNRYAREGWIRVRALLVEFLAGLTPEMARQRGRRLVDSGQRTYSFTKGPKLAGVEAIVWTRTMSDVRLDTAPQCCQDVREWAAHIVSDTEVLMHALQG